MPFFRKLSDILLKPSLFFSKIKKEGYKEPIFFQMILFITTFILSYPAVLFMLSTNPAFAQLGFDFSTLFMVFLLPVWLILGLLALIAGDFIGAAILHIFVLIFGGEDYLKTFKAYTYGYTPKFVFFFAVYFNLIPVIGFIFSSLFGLAATLYKIIVTAIGIKQLHKFSTGKAIAVVLIPVAILFVLLILFIVFILLALGLSLASMGQF